MWAVERFGTSGLLGSLIWGLEIGSSGPLSFTVRWLTMVSLAESIKGPCSRFCLSPLCRVPLMTFKDFL